MARIKILIADDSNTMRQLTLQTLRALGYRELDEARDGRQALMKLNTYHYDVLVTDWNMPGLNGFDLVKIMKSDERLSRIKVIMLTSETSMYKVKQIVELGINEYICKPFSPDMLAKKISRLNLVQG
ncbi:response regulator [Pseudoalteromonas luteoviolacea]|uniref:Response regulatory domain-containing protein n=1 Tax=Pseudoalteromonas luteoviolacea S4060-1 TaxID=1365257 RepID=A0A167ND40_9GAMM|nr:response regulator [Pseudoalteromonas luteoviolacea]KZN28818.1 hypothetical protein N480_08615 [Pseudoalteromonas luteoviolacea S2607]KZN67949.1 hypothetical protein N478_17140 [Pseudoalteromonas luteoviolacea S4060-1]